MTVSQQRAPVALATSDPQRGDVPYRWPRGPKAPGPEQRKPHVFWPAVAILALLTSASAVWYMVAHPNGADSTAGARRPELSKTP
jgi:hypothetical protein